MLRVIVMLKDEIPLRLKFFSKRLKIFAKTDWYLELFIIPSTLIKAPVPAKEKHDDVASILHPGDGVLLLMC